MTPTPTLPSPVQEKKSASSSPPTISNTLTVPLSIDNSSSIVPDGNENHANLPPPVVSSHVPKPLPDSPLPARRSPRSNKVHPVVVPYTPADLCRSNRSEKETCQSMHFHDAFIESVPDPTIESTAFAQFAYSVELGTGLDTGQIECSDPRAYTAKFKTCNEDNHSYKMI